MNYIKVKDEFEKTLLVNLDSVSRFCGTNKTTTIYDRCDGYIRVNIPIEKFQDAIEATTHNSVFDVSA